MILRIFWHIICVLIFQVQSLPVLFCMLFPSLVAVKYDRVACVSPKTGDTLFFFCFTNPICIPNNLILKKKKMEQVVWKINKLVQVIGTRPTLTKTPLQKETIPTRHYTKKTPYQKEHHAKKTPYHKNSLARRQSTWTPDTISCDGQQTAGWPSLLPCPRCTGLQNGGSCFDGCPSGHNWT